ncbi:MAG: protein-disulfide reductase DsbD domain-containing protein [Verrucomicrobiota bacterium]
MGNLKNNMVILSLLAALWVPLAAQDFDPFAQDFAKKVEKTETQARLLSDHTLIAPGQPFTLALEFTHPEGWYSYYKNPGTLGEALKINWTLPDGFTVDYEGWPTPKLKGNNGINSIVYLPSVTHLYTITPPDNLSPGSTAQLSAQATWQICDPTGCIPEDATLSLTLPVAAEPVLNLDLTSLFDEARKQLPASLPEDTKLTLSESNNIITLTLDPSSGLNPETIHFFDEDGQVDVQTPQKATLENETLTVTLNRNQGNDFMDAPEPKPVITGILTDGQTSYQVSSKITGEAALTAAQSESESNASPNLLAILGGMFIGGLILNLMPCVFPVIGIKIMSFVEQAGHHRKKVALHGLTFAAGVLATFWLLSTIMLLGGINSWGGQLENPYIMLGLIVVMLLLAMNMFGVFEIGTSATGVGSNLTRKEGLSGSFFSGVLAVVVATPCSAPFLGAALGAAVALPTFWFFTAFTIMALGLATPYLILSAFPDLVKKLPRPGAWMESFKQGMSFLLFATVGYLLWVYSFQVFEHDYGQKGLWVMIGLALIAAAAWVWGRWTTPIRKPKTKWIARALTLLLIVTGIIFAAPGEDTSPPENETTTSSSALWQKWSKEKEQKLLAEGTPVYIDFTARWCLTCQVNKKNAYPAEVLAAFKEKGVVLLKADKTSSNPAIDAELKNLNRTAIPVNVLYSPNNPNDPTITPEVLTPGYLLNLIETKLN